MYSQAVIGFCKPSLSVHIYSNYRPADITEQSQDEVKTLLNKVVNSRISYILYAIHSSSTSPYGNSTKARYFSQFNLSNDIF